MTTYMHRLRRMTREEASWRLRVLARTIVDRLHARVWRPRWNRADLRDALRWEAVDPVLRTHIERGDWLAAHRSLARVIRARASRFPLEPSALFDVREQILARWPEAERQAADRADRLIAGRYDLLGYRGLSYSHGGHTIDWHFDPVYNRSAPLAFWADVPFLDPKFGDHKVIWEINRHQQWLGIGRALWLTRDRRYAWAIVEQLESWMRANPPHVGINWASMLELAFRSIAWTWAIHALLADPDDATAGSVPRPWLVDMLVGLDRQLTHVEENLSRYFSPNTHLTGEALGLYVAGIAFPELARSTRWMQTGRAILLQEIDRQIGADGGHLERSTQYHRYTLDFYMLALLMAERAQDIEAIARFTDAVTRLAEFARAIADDAGRLPLIGDDDAGMLWPVCEREFNDIRDSLALAAVILGRAELAPWGVPEEVFWIAGRTAIEFEPLIEARRIEPSPVTSRVFIDTGYVVSRGPGGDHLIFDAGPHGYLNAGHAHADALSVTLSVRGRPLLIDPGTATYTVDPVLRDRMRRAASHNTMIVDGRAPSTPGAAFQWRSRTDARLDVWRQNPRFDWAEGAHSGFGDLRHRRSVFRAGDGTWLIVDELLGRGRHEAALHWHFDPSWMLAADDSCRLRLTHVDGDFVWMLHDAAQVTLLHGDERAGLGWYAPAYGALLPTWTARLTRRAIAPFSMATWIVPMCADADPRLERIAGECDAAGSQAVVVRMTNGSQAHVTMMRPGEPPHRESRGCSVPDYHTNARLLHYRTASGRLTTLHVADASHVLALREGWLSVAAEEPLVDLSAVLHEHMLDLASTTPPPRLRLQGSAVASARVLRLNGRVAPDSAREREDTFVIGGADWGDEQRAYGETVTPATAEVPAAPIDDESVTVGLPPSAGI